MLILTSAVYPQNSRQATDNFQPRYGIFGQYARNMDVADFTKLPGIPNCCQGFQSGSGNGFSLGLLYEHPLGNSFLLGIRLGLSNYDGLLTRDEGTTVILNGTPQAGTFEHYLDSKISALEIHPMISYNLFKGLFVSAGFSGGIVINKQFTQKETLIGSGTFIDSLGNDSKKATRNEYSGEIPNVNSINLNLLGGLSYELPLNEKKTLLLVPEAYYYYGLTAVVKDLKWNINAFRAGLALKYSPQPSLPVKYEHYEKIDTIRHESPDIKEVVFIPGIARKETKETEVDNSKLITETTFRTDTLLYPKKFRLTAEIDAVGVGKDGTEIPNPLVKIEEFISSRLQPLLNYVFFDENSSELPARYTRLSPEMTRSFNEDKLFYSETLPTYYNILNIVGSRLRARPGAKLRIVGCNDGYTSEKNNLDVSGKRAETVKNYLKDVWEIDEKRMITESRNLPEKQSTPISEKDKYEENRRAELYSDDYEIIKPVFSADTIRTSNPPVIRFKASTTAEAGLLRWKVNITQQNIKIKDFESEGNVPPSIDWNMEQEQMSMPRLQVPLVYALTVNDTRGNLFQTNPKSIEIKLITISKKRTERIADKEIDRYSLILFDFDKADINKNNQRIVDLIKGRIKENSAISIAGYTDRTGEEDYNLKLSGQRADNTLKSLTHSNTTSKGMGEAVLLYNNDIPEGRFYCRTVNIVVETQVEEKL